MVLCSLKKSTLDITEIEHRLGIRYYQGIVNFVVYNNAVIVMLKKLFISYR